MKILKGYTYDEYDEDTDDWKKIADIVISEKIEKISELLLTIDDDGVLFKLLPEIDDDFYCCQKCSLRDKDYSCAEICSKIYKACNTHVYLKEIELYEKLFMGVENEGV